VGCGAFGGFETSAGSFSLGSGPANNPNAL